MEIELTVASAASADVESDTTLSRMVHLAGSAAAGDTTADIAVCLAASVDSLFNFIGSTEGATVVVTRAELSGPISVGDTWSVAVAEATATRVVQSGDSGTDIAFALPAQRDPANGFTAGSAAQHIVVTSVVGGNFGVTAGVVPSGGGTVDTATAIAVALSGPAITGDAWTLTVDGVEYMLTVRAGDGLPTLAAAPATMVNAASGYVAGSESAIISVTKLSGGDLEAELVVAP